MASLIDLAPAPLHRYAGHLQGLVRTKLWLQVSLALVCGTLTGFALGPELGWVSPGASRVVVAWAAFPGKLFIATIQMIVVPLVFASIVGGLGSVASTKELRAIGVRTALYFLTTSFIATALGLAVGFLLAPGALIDRSAVETGIAGAALPTKRAPLPTLATAPSAVLGLLPANPLASLARGEMLQIVLFALVVGVALVVLPAKKAAPLLDLLDSLQNVCMTIVKWAMRLAPVAVFGLSLRLTASVGANVLVGMAAYVGTVLVGLALLVVIYVVLAATLGRCGPVRFLRAASGVQLLAFSTSSSAAVMPVSLHIAEEELGVRPRMARFVIPLGATVDMDGTALYQSVATVFLAQVYGVNLGVGGTTIVVFTVVAASIGAPAAPGVGMVILSGVLASVGIPAGGVALLMGVDRLLDMARTSVNVTGDLTASLVLDRWLGAKGDVEASAEPAPS